MLQFVLCQMHACEFEEFVSTTTVPSMYRLSGWKLLVVALTSHQTNDTSNRVLYNQCTTCITNYNAIWLCVYLNIYIDADARKLISLHPHVNA